MAPIHRRLAASTLLCSGLVMATAALAQTRGKPKPAPAASASAASPAPAGPPATSAAPASAAPAAATSSSGPVPPPPGAATGGGALSPLNPAAAEFSDAGGLTPGATVDYDRLLADVAALRARVAAVSDTLFHSRVAITVETSGDHQRIASMSVSLDDGVVWTSPQGFRADDATSVYEHAVAPGHHAVTVEIERRDDRDDIFRTSQRSRFAVDVPADQRLGLAFKLWDDSGIGGDFKSDRKGTYDLRVRLKAQAQPLGK